MSGVRLKDASQVLNFRVSFLNLVSANRSLDDMPSDNTLHSNKRTLVSIATSN